MPKSIDDGGWDLGGGPLSTFLRGGTLTLGGSIVSSVLAFVLTLVITRGLGAGGAGALFVVIALFAIVGDIVELGGDTGLVRMLPRNHALGRADEGRTLLVALVPVGIASLVLGACGVALAPRLADLFVSGPHRADGVTYIRVLAAFLPASALMTVALAGTRGFGTMAPYVAVQNVGVPLARPVLVWAAIATGLGAAAVALGWALPTAAGLVAAVVCLAVLLRRSERADGGRAATPRPYREIGSEFWRFAAPRALAVILTIGLAWVDVLLIGAIRTSGEAGVYTAALRLLGVGQFTLQAAGIAIAPQLSELISARDAPRAQFLYQTVTAWLMAPAWPAYLVLALYAPLLLRMFGPAFVTGQEAVVILVPAFMIFVGTGNNKIALLMGGASSWNLLSVGLSLALNIGLNLLLIPRFGINGAAVAYAVSLIADTLVTTIAVRVLLGLQPFGRGYPVVALGSLVSFGVLGAIIRGVLGTSIPSLAALAVVGTGVYVAVLWRFRDRLEVSSLRASLRAGGWPRSGPPGTARNQPKAY